MKTLQLSITFALCIASLAFLPHVVAENTSSNVNRSKLESSFIGIPFHIKINETFSQDSFPFKVKLLNVTSDSRCPQGVTCIWQGQVTISIDIIQNTRDLGNFSLVSTKGKDQAAFGKYILHLRQVNPYPSGKKILPSDYDVEFVISNQNVLSPLKQLKSGIAAQDVTCSQGLQLVIKEKDGSPACVRPDTAQRLIERGWARQES